MSSKREEKKELSTCTDYFVAYYYSWLESFCSDIKKTVNGSTDNGDDQW